MLQRHVMSENSKKTRDWDVFTPLRVQTPPRKRSLAERLLDLIRGKRRRLRREDPNIYPLY